MRSAALLATTLALGSGSLASRIPRARPRRSPEPELPVPEGTVVDQCTWFHSTIEQFEDCQYIESWWGISHEEFVLWNPSVKDDCSGIAVGFSYCVEVNNGDGLTTTQPPPTSTGVPVPSPTLDGTAKNCDAFHYADKGDTCDEVCSQNGISMAQFMEWNTNVEEDCSGFWAEYYYCVSIEGHTPITITPSPTETGGGSSPSPTLDGTAEDCDAYHYVETGDNCADICSKYGISMDHLMEWNTIIEEDCSGLWAKYYYCVSVEGHSPSPSETESAGDPGPTPPALTQPGIVEDCETWHVAEKGDTCDTIVYAWENLSFDIFWEWNPAVGLECDGLWADYAYCVGTPGRPAVPADGDGGGDPPTGCEEAHPSPTQPGALCACDKWHKVTEGDNCWSLAVEYDVTEEQLREWNEGFDCVLWQGYYVCVGA